MFQFLVFLVLAVFGLFIDFEEAVELHYRSGDTEPVHVAARLGIDVDRGLIKHRGIHLRRDEALPDQFVNLEFVFLQVLFDMVGMARRPSRANGLMRRLRFLLLLICIGRFGQIIGAVLAADVFAYFCDRLGGHAGGIGSHVSDQADQALVAEFDTFIEALRDHHGALYAEAQLARGILLQLAGSKWRSGIATPLFLFRRTDDPAGLFKRQADFLGVLAVGDFDFLLAFAEKARVECRRLIGGEIGIDRPVFFFFEGLNFAFAIDDQAKGDGLHTPGGKAAADFVP